MGLTVFANEIRIQPGADGSFLVRVGEDTDYGRKPASAYGFTNVTDLMTWLQRAAQAQQAAETMQLTEAQVVPGVGGAQWPAFPTVGDTRRTTALGSLADRLAAAEQPKGAA